MAHQFILLPGRGLKVPGDDNQMMLLMTSVGHARSTDPALDLLIPNGPTLKVIDSINEDGPKLVETEAESALALRLQGLRLAPVRRYRLAAATRFSPKPPIGVGSSSPLVVSVVDRSTRAGVDGAVVSVFTDFANNEGAEGVTDALGQCTLDVGGVASVERVYVHPPLVGYWGSYQTAVACATGICVELDSISAGHTDSLAHFYPTRALHAGTGVRVAIVDTGIDNSHPDLNHVTQGKNTARGEVETLWQDNGTGHGTHVAGIIGARGTHQGLAPACELVSFRAFATGQTDTTNYQILKAIMRAIDVRPDIINLSLDGEDRPDDALREAIQDARDHGALVVAAAGNGAKAQVGFPAFYAFSEGLSVSALGRKGAFPSGSYEESDIGTAFGVSDADSFFARFSNAGDVSLTAPGVGIVSTVPGGYGVMSGTSMAAPAVTGRVAGMLSDDAAANGHTAVINMPRDSKRALAMISLASGSAHRVFGDVKLEGDGMIA